ncbi:MAG: cation:dicarboxylase symporter family transporter [Bdellovibrionaceae bacterium]|nr:cation:dicarboxylase symporter family transporter [Pseudobdellovibrionaceae bacterium]NUM57750.1 cation:dicarboxylase symporter family transporter [Pseudobdellovibrionaceae bacterium]
MKKHSKSSKLTLWILVALVLGFIVGVWFPDVGHGLKPFRTLFINGVKCIIAPLIFSSIVVGICSAGSINGLGKMGLRAIIWFEVATTVALGVGLFFVNFFKPGAGLSIGTVVDPKVTQAAQNKMSMGGFVEHLLPTNFAEAVVKGDVLQLVLFSIVFGMAVLMAGEKAKPVLNFCEGLNQVMFKFTELVMSLAPIGVGAAMASAIAEHGIDVLLPMAKLVGVLYLALITFVLITLIPALKWAKIKVKEFLIELRPSLILAFATTSSESAYPDALKSLEKMGVSNRIASFVLPLGYSFNLDGSTLYLAMASVFIAQAAGIDLSIQTQLAMMLMLMLTTKGVAAVPRASMVVLSATLTSFGLPLEGVVLIMGVDEFMDMARTTVNLLGNCVATTVVSRWEGEKLSSEFQHHS